MENNTTNILVDKKICDHKLLYENKTNIMNKLHGFVEIVHDYKLSTKSKNVNNKNEVSIMVGYSYMNPHLFFRLFKFRNKSILHSRIRSIIYLVDDINHFMIFYILLNGMMIINKLLKYMMYF